VIEASVRKRLGQFSLDCDLNESGFVCLEGRNGAGKTTLLKVVAGLLPPDSGHVKVNGRDVTSLPIEKRGVVFVVPGSAIPSMEVDQHLCWGAGLKKIVVGREELAAAKSDLGIDVVGRVGKLSLGMRARVALATALLSAPAGILVDEAFSNLHGREEFISAFRRLAASAGIDVIYAAQDESNGRLADHLYAMEDGKAARKF